MSRFLVTVYYELLRESLAEVFIAGPIVKWYYTSMAWTKAGSDSRWVHEKFLLGFAPNSFLCYNRIISSD